MSETLGKLVVSLEANIVEFTSAMGVANKTARDAMQGVSSAVEGAKHALELLGVAATIHEFVEMGKRAVEAGDQLAKLSEKTGISVERLSELKFAGQLADVGLDALATGIKKLSVNMEDALTSKTGKAAEAFKALGISVKDTSTGGLRSADDVLYDLADSFEGMKDGAGKTAFAVAILGRAGMDLIPVLNKGSEGLKAAAKEAQDLHIVFSTELAKSSEELNDNFKRLQSTFGKDLAEFAVPALNRITAAMIQAKKDAGGLMAAWVGLGGVWKEFFVADDTAVTLKNLDIQIAAVQKTIAALSTQGKGDEGGWLGRLVNGSTDDKLKTANAQLAALKAQRDALVAGPPAKLELPEKDEPPPFGGKDNSDRQMSWLSSLEDKLNAAKGDTSEFSRVLEAVTNGPAKDFDSVTQAIALALAGEIDELKEATKENEDHARVLEKVDRETQAAAKSADEFALKQQQSIDAIRAKTAAMGMTPHEADKAAVLFKIDKDTETEIQKITEKLGKLGDSQGIDKAVGDLQRLAAQLKGETAAAMDAAKEKQDALNASWEVGASEALRVYLQDVSNTAKATGDLVTKACQGMEDALVKFVQTGKLDFRSLWDSITADLIRLQIRQSITGPMAQGMQGMGGLGGIGSYAIGSLGNFFQGTQAPAPVVDAIVKAVPSFDVGTPFVPQDMLALVHQGERIVPAAQNNGGSGGGSVSVTNHFVISGPVDSRTQAQIAAMAGSAIARAMRRNG